MTRNFNSEGDGGRRRPTRPLATATATGQQGTDGASAEARNDVKSPAFPARAGQCALCHSLIFPALIRTEGKAMNFGAIDPLADATIEHIAKDHAAEMQNILMAATLLTVYLSTAFLSIDWPEWDETREQMHAGLELIFTSADAEPAFSEDVAKGSVPVAGANG